MQPSPAVVLELLHREVALRDIQTPERAVQQVGQQRDDHHQRRGHPVLGVAAQQVDPFKAANLENGVSHFTL
jgi:hypothetical protein